MSSFSVKFGCLFAALFFFSNGIIGQDMQDVSFFVADVDPETAYCFRFTWLGPKWDNTSEANGTCDSVPLVPCKEPLVITEDSTPPNTTYMWYNYDLNQIACRLTEGEVCTKWVQYYGGNVEFITYMCSKFTVDGAPKVDWEGCEEDTASKNNTFLNRVCACRSAPGDMPCNNTSHRTPLTLLLVVAFLAALYCSSAV